MPRPPSPFSNRRRPRPGAATPASDAPVSPLAWEPDAVAVAVPGRTRSTMRAAEVAVTGSPAGSSLAPMATSLDEEDELFFADGDLASLREGTGASSATAPRATSDGDAAPDVHASIRSRADERRRELGRFVAASLAVCTAVCVAAAVRAGLGPTDAIDARDAPSTANAAMVVPSAPSTVPVTPASAPDGLPLAPAAKPKRATATALTPASTVASRGKIAHDEKEAARRLLAQGNAKDAVASAERSVALDPSDADAWLILGAAHQEMRHAGSARASFRACVKEAKKGPVAECRAMLR
jgi:hypothetical protein